MRRLKNKINQKVNESLNPDKNKEEVKKEDEQGDKEKDNEKEKEKSGQSELQTYSKFDFIPGEKVIFFEDFSQDKVGDFPALWNTNVSAEVMTTMAVIIIFLSWIWKRKVNTSFSKA